MHSDRTTIIFWLIVASTIVSSIWIMASCERTKIAVGKGTIGVP